MKRTQRPLLRNVTARVISIVFVLLLMNMLLLVNYDGLRYNKDYRETTHEDTMTHQYTDAELLPFEPEVVLDFSTNHHSTAKIPRIIHQTFKTENIPKAFAPFVSSFVAHNPEWTYYFWTDEAAKRLIEDRYPHLLTLWKNYSRDINRADALRYIVLYEYGGVYADLDVENFRPLHRATTKYSCIIPPDSFEHNVFVFNVSFMLSNAFLMCRAKHPFLKMVVEGLSQFFPLAEEVDATGNSFLTSQFIAYNRMSPGDIFRHTVHNYSNAPYVFTGNRNDIDSDAVYLPNTAYFASSITNNVFGLNEYKQRCKHVDTLSVLVRRACSTLSKRKFLETKHYYAFTKHHRKQAYYRPSWFMNSTVPITGIVKHRKLYNS